MKKAVLTFICFVIMMGAVGAATIDRPYAGPEAGDMVSASVRIVPPDRPAELQDKAAQVILMQELTDGSMHTVNANVLMK